MITIHILNLNAQYNGIWRWHLWEVRTQWNDQKNISNQTPRASLVAQMVKNLPAIQETQVQPLGQEDPLEKGMAMHSSILAWRIPMDKGAWWATVHAAATAAKSLQSCLTLCDPMDCSPPHSSVHGIFQARILEWVAISSSQSRDWNPVSCIAGGFFTTWAMALCKCLRFYCQDIPFDKGLVK